MDPWWYSRVDRVDGVSGLTKMHSEIRVSRVHWVSGVTRAYRVRGKGSLIKVDTNVQET